MTASALSAMVMPTERQPWCFASEARTGRNTSCPLALAAVSVPVTMPRCFTNQREATVEANTVAMQPEPVPTTTPHSRNSCHGECICVVSSAPEEMTASDAMVTRRSP